MQNICAAGFRTKNRFEYRPYSPTAAKGGSQQFPTTLQIARELEYLYAAELGADVLKLGERQILEFHFQMVDPSLLPDSDEHLERGGCVHFGGDSDGTGRQERPL